MIARVSIAAAEPALALVYDPDQPGNEAVYVIGAGGEQQLDVPAGHQLLICAMPGPEADGAPLPLSDLAAAPLERAA